MLYLIECTEKRHIPLDKILSISTSGARSMAGIWFEYVAILKKYHEILTNILFMKKRLVHRRNLQNYRIADCSLSCKSSPI